MPAEFTSNCGENGLFGSGSTGGTLGGCCAHVSQEPSSSETRKRLSLNKAVSFSFNPGTGLGTGDSGLGRGPGSLALKRALFCASKVVATIPVSKTNPKAKSLIPPKGFSQQDLRHSFSGVISAPSCGVVVMGSLQNPV